MSVSVAQAGSKAYYLEGTQKKVIRDVTLDSSYPTGGETVNASDLGLNWIDTAWAKIKTPGGTVNQVNAEAIVASTGASLVVKVYDETPAEVADTSDLSSTVVRVQALGY